MEKIDLDTLCAYEGRWKINRLLHACEAFGIHDIRILSIIEAEVKSSTLDLELYKKLIALSNGSLISGIYYSN